MATMEEKKEYFNRVRDCMAGLFLREGLSKGKTITIPSLDIQIVPVKCGECDGTRNEGGKVIICSTRLSTDTICPYGKGKTAEKGKNELEGGQ